MITISNKVVIQSNCYCLLQIQHERKKIICRKNGRKSYDLHVYNIFKVQTLDLCVNVCLIADSVFFRWL